MARLAGGPVRTFSIGFEEKEYDELAHARSVARKFGTEHHELVVRPKDLDLMDRLAWALDEPFGDTSAIPTYLVSRLAAGSVKVVLSGDGGDELFAGYDKYVVEERERRREPYLRPFRGLLERAARLMPEGMRGRNLVRHSALAGAARYLDASTLFPEAALRRLLRPEARERLAPFDPAREAWRGLEGAGGHWLSALQAHDLKTYLPLDVLTKVDRMSMAHGLEVRVPLLDHPLVEFAATLPPESGLRGGVTKRLFKRALRGVLPDAIIDRPKHGFAVPFGRWLRGPLKDDLRDLLLSERCRDRGVFEPAAVEALLERHDHGRDLDLHLWTLCSFELWCRTFLDAAPAASAREAS
jgi:asparagine synthase (glutamine-hydrolysing)